MLKRLSFFLLLGSQAICAQTPVSKEIGETHEREIAVDIRTILSKPISEDVWKNCLPQKGTGFPNAWNAALEDKIFAKKELPDTKECKVTSCAFRYRPDERADLQKAKTDAAIKKKVLEFYTDRAKGRVQPYAHEEEFRIQKGEGAFDFCKSSDFDQLLKERNHSKAVTLIKVDLGKKSMRPTTRLTRGLSFSSGKSLCWAEALLFSNHYDLDRIELWEASPQELRFVIRERLDFLHSWWRRARKKEITEVLEAWAIDETNRVLACMTKSSPTK